jgi:hypothetical protein
MAKTRIDSSTGGTVRIYDDLQEAQESSKWMAASLSCPCYSGEWCMEVHTPSVGSPAGGWADPVPLSSSSEAAPCTRGHG